MIARTQLAVLQFKCVIDAPLAKRNKDNSQMYKPIQFSKLSQACGKTHQGNCRKTIPQLSLWTKSFP